MGWNEFTSFISAMNRENERGQPSPDSWEGTENDPWWVNARRERAELQAR